jgi:hypothetical protein
MNKMDNQIKIIENDVNDIYEKNHFNINCNHIWVTTAFGHNENEEDFTVYHTCVKCQQVKRTKNFVKENLDDEKAKEIYLNIEQLPEYPISVYNIIKNMHPELDDRKTATILKQVIEKNINLAKEKKDDFARKLNIDPSKINGYVGFGE